MKFDWKYYPGTKKYEAEAQAVGEELLKLEKSGVLLKPIEIAKAAEKKRKFPNLNSCFEWDDEEAAVQYRITQAREIVTRLVIITEEDDSDKTPIRAFVSFKDEDNSHRYINIEAAMSDDEIRQSVIEEARRSLIKWQNKYERLLSYSEELSAAISDASLQLETLANAEAAGV